MAIHDKTKAQNETIERPTMTHPVRLLNLQGKLSQVTIMSISNFTLHLYAHYVLSLVHIKSKSHVTCCKIFYISGTSKRTLIIT